MSIRDRSLEIFNPEGCDRIFSIPGPSGLGDLRGTGEGVGGGTFEAYFWRGAVFLAHRTAWVALTAANPPLRPPPFC